jgi:hypothetical protein
VVQASACFVFVAFELPVLGHEEFLSRLASSDRVAG